MKRNKLVLIAGILMILGAVACIVATIINCIQLKDLMVIINSEQTAETATEDFNLFATLLMVGYISCIFINICESILFLVLGIMLIVKSARKVPLNNYKSFAITTQILLYIGACSCLISELLISGIIFIFFLSSAILLSVALSQNKKETEEKLNADFGGYKDNPHHNFDKNHGSDANYYVNEFSDKIKSLHQLKESGVITEEEYTRLVRKVLGLDDK
ncbi:MAG: SHOCT domain-containing protein [Christensenellales bacterium]